MHHQTAWLVDIGYVVKVGSKRFKLDYTVTANWLSDRYGPTATFLFNGYDRELGIPDGLHKFYDAMRAEGMKVCLHPMSGSPYGRDHRQRRVDVDMAAHLVWQSFLPEVGQIVITTGDQDFRPAVDIAREQANKHIVLLSYAQDVSADLISGVHEHLRLDDFQELLAR